MLAKRKPWGKYANSISWSELPTRKRERHVREEILCIPTTTCREQLGRKKRVNNYPETRGDRHQPQHVALQHGIERRQKLETLLISHSGYVRQFSCHLNSSALLKITKAFRSASSARRSLSKHGVTPARCWISTTSQRRVNTRDGAPRVEERKEKHRGNCAYFRDESNLPQAATIVPRYLHKSS